MNDQMIIATDFNDLNNGYYLLFCSKIFELNKLY